MRSCAATASSSLVIVESKLPGRRPPCFDAGRAVAGRVFRAIRRSRISFSSDLIRDSEVMVFNVCEQCEAGSAKGSFALRSCDAETRKRSIRFGLNLNGKQHFNYVSVVFLSRRR